MAFDANATAKIGDGVGNTLYASGVKTFEKELYDGTDSKGKVIKGLLALRECETGEFLYLSTLCRELKFLQPDGKYEKVVRQGFEKKFHDSLGKTRADRKSSIVSQKFWETLHSYLGTTRPDDATAINLNLQVEREMAERIIDGKPDYRQSCIVRIVKEGSAYINTPVTTAPTPSE